jgi:hypothetical protein
MMDILVHHQKPVLVYILDILTILTESNVYFGRSSRDSLNSSRTLLAKASIAFLNKNIFLLYYKQYNSFNRVGTTLAQHIEWSIMFLRR